MRRAVEHVDARVLGREPVGELAGAVGRGVVDHEHAVAVAQHLAERAHHRLEVLALVVGRAGRSSRARRPVSRKSAYHRRREPDAAEERRAGGAVRPPRRPDGDRGRATPSGSRAYRRAATRIRETSSSVAQLALDGRAKELQGIGKTIEEKIVQVVEDGEVEALTKRKAEVPPEVATFIRLPGLGPKTARRLWQELGITTVADLRAAAEAQQLRKVAGLGAKLEERILVELAEAEGRPRSRTARCSGTRCRSCAPSRPSVAAHPGRRARLDRRLGAPLPRDGARPRPDRDRDRRARADRRVLLVPVGRRGRGEGRHEGDRRRARRPALRPARRPAGVVRQPAPALHRLEGPQRRAARGGRAARALGLRVRDRRGRDRRGALVRDRGGGLRASSATSGSRPSCARTAASSTRRATATLPKLVELARPARRPAHAHDLVGRQGHARGDGRAARSRRATTTTRSATTRSGCATSGSSSRHAAIDALNEQVPLTILKGIEVNIRANGELDVADEDPRRARLGRRVGAQLASTRTRPSACSRRWRTRTSTASATSRTARSASARRRTSTSSA